MPHDVAFACVPEEMMGRVRVLYHTSSGNTARMAGLVSEGTGAIPGREVRVIGHTAADWINSPLGRRPLDSDAIAGG
jgi:hypothetical protein